jgi:hypothetical protein
MFLDLAAGDLRLHFGSPCIDTGTNLSALVTTDVEGAPRPLDGDGDGTAAFDIGAYEFNLLSTVGSDWLVSYGLNPNDPMVFASDRDMDGLNSLQEWVSDTNPTNASSLFKIVAISNRPPAEVSFFSSSYRVYTLVSSTNLSGNWELVEGQANVPGTGALMTLQDTNVLANHFYRVRVFVP